MKITLVRHAQVQEFYIGKYNGHIDIGLSEHGKLQAQELAEKLQDEEFDKIYCSDLIRARETLKAFKLSGEVIFSDRLREKSWGVHEGKSFDEIVDEGIEYKNFGQWISALDGEEIASYTRSLTEYFYNIILKDKSKNILIVTHSGTIKTLISLIDNISLEQAFSRELPYSSFITLNRLNMTFIYK